LPFSVGFLVYLYFNPDYDIFDITKEDFHSVIGIVLLLFFFIVLVMVSIMFFLIFKMFNIERLFSKDFGRYMRKNLNLIDALELYKKGNLIIAKDTISLLDGYYNDITKSFFRFFLYILSSGFFVGIFKVNTMQVQQNTHLGKDKFIFFLCSSFFYIFLSFFLIYTKNKITSITRGNMINILNYIITKKNHEEDMEESKNLRNAILETKKLN
jgi:drug/metabolite transporter (DMT)-like permease